jgi:thimet oligopeptidase
MNRRISLLAVCLVGVGIAGCASRSASSPTGQGVWALETTPLERSAPRLDNTTVEHLVWVDVYRDRAVQAPTPRTIENTLQPFNSMLMHLEAAAAECELFSMTHPDATVRDIARKGHEAVVAKMTEINLDRELYDAVSAVDLSGADEGTRFFVHKTLRDFRRAGVDRSEEERARIRELTAEIARIGQEFQKNLAADVRTVYFNSLSELDGLPDDWIAQHQPGPDGRIAVTTQYPDFFPFMTYARSHQAREQLYREYMNRGYPANIETLDRLIARRHDLATLLGYAHWADYVTEDKMIGSAANAQAFIDRLAATSAEPAKRDLEVLLARKRADFPDAERVEDYERMYYENLVKLEQFSFDPQEARRYFNFPQVRQGLFDVTSKMFDLDYRKVEGLKLWHPEVEAYDVLQDGKLLGRFYLDLHPRADKYGHAACFGYRQGVLGRRLPQAVLVCNFPNPAGSPSGLALMDHSEVVVFFHEFGHLLHAIIGGHQPWVTNSGITTEHDFVEAPSQMLEEWCWDVETLQLFARDPESGQPIPAELVTKLKAASDFGRGVWTARQVFLASLSLNYYSRDPKTLDTTKVMAELMAEYSPWPYVPGTHSQCNFTHLDGYSAMYYTYLWSKVISKDLFTVFADHGLMNPAKTRQYREAVIAPGGSAPAADLVADFLGRPYSFEAFESWLNAG